MKDERIIEVLEEVYREEISGNPEDSFKSLLEEFETRDPEFPVYWIAETVIGTVEKLTARKLGWYVEALKDEWNFSGEFAFVLVDETGKCLTFSKFSDGCPTVSVILPINSLDEAVAAVKYFLSLLRAEQDASNS